MYVNLQVKPEQRWPDAFPRKNKPFSEVISGVWPLQHTFWLVTAGKPLIMTHFQCLSVCECTQCQAVPSVRGSNGLYIIHLFFCTQVEVSLVNDVLCALHRWMAWPTGGIAGTICSSCSSPLLINWFEEKKIFTFGLLVCAPSLLTSCNPPLTFQPTRVGLQ